MLFKRFLLGMILSGLALAAPLQASWVQVDLFDTETKSYSDKDDVAGYWYKSYAMMVSPTDVSGIASAQAKSLTESVTYTQSPGNGIHFEMWLHFPPGVGEVEIRILASTSAACQTKGPGLGKAAALAYCRSDYWFDNERNFASAISQIGAQNTMVEGLPTFFAGIEIGVPRIGGITAGGTVPIIWFSGSGLIPSSDLDYIADFACPVKKFRYRSTSKASVFVWARGASGNQTGRANCRLEGSTKKSIVLITQSQCPVR